MQPTRDPHHRRPRAKMLGAILTLVILTGCNDTSRNRIEVPPLAPSEAGRLALADYDANKDSSLDAQELEKCPALKKALAKLDTNHDKKLSAGEVSDRIAQYQESRIGMMALTCNVTLDNKPLSGATVTLTPERFMGTGVKEASGITDESGFVVPIAPGLELPGLHCAFYRVAISKKNAQGKEAIPPRYNTQTTLGIEIGPDIREGNITFELKSK